MSILKFWFMACAIFCIYYLNMLAKERYEVEYLAKNQSDTKPNILACKRLCSFNFKNKSVELSHLRAYLFDHFNQSLIKGNGPTSNKKLILDSVKTGNYLIFNELFCIIVEEDKDFASRSFSSSSMFFAFKKSTLDFVRITSYYERIDQLVMLKKAHPYSDCSESVLRFHCLNECFKKSFRLSRYFYDGNETGLIHLDSPVNQSIEESEMICSRKCEKENCKFVRLVPISFHRLPKISTLEALPKISEFEYWVQFVGLICLFANISLSQFLFIVIKFTSLKVKRSKVRTAFIWLKWTIFFLSLILCGYLCADQVLEYQKNERDPPKKEITKNNVKQKVLNLVVCVDISHFF